jgi:hypothetical protein
MTEVKLSKHHRTSIELCYEKKGGLWLLYDDTTKPRKHIATICGSDFDGFQWRGECELMTNFWQQTTHFGQWRAALMDAVLAYIN